MIVLVSIVIQCHDNDIVLLIIYSFLLNYGKLVNLHALDPIALCHAVTVQ